MKRQKPWLLLVMSIMAGLGIIQMIWLLGRTTFDVVSAHQTNIALRNDIDARRSEVAEFKVVAKYLNNPSFLEATARCRGYVYKDETLVYEPAQQTKPQHPACASQYIKNIEKEQ